MSISVSSVEVSSSIPKLVSDHAFLRREFSHQLDLLSSGYLSVFEIEILLTQILVSAKQDGLYNARVALLRQVRVSQGETCFFYLFASKNRADDESLLLVNEALVEEELGLKERLSRGFPRLAIF